MQEFDVNIASQRDVRVTIKEFLLDPPFREKGSFLWLARVYAVVWDISRERNDGVFRGRDWSLVRFHESLWASVSKLFCNYSLGNLLLSWNPFL